MNETVQSFKIICLALAAILIFTLIIFVGTLTRQMRESGAALNITLNKADAALSTLQAAGQQAMPAIQQLNDATARQIDTLNKTNTEIYRSSAALKTFIVLTDKKVNGQDGILDLFSRNLSDSDVLLRRGSNSLGDLTDDGTSALVHVTAAIDALESDAAAARPAIDSANAASGSAAASAAHLSEASAHLNDASADVAAWIHRETTPVRGTWNVVKSFLRSFAGPAAQVATAARP
jgi:hypothetical protein